MSLPKMYVNTCDATMFFIPIFNYFFNKYFPNQEVVWLGFKKPDFSILDNQKYVSLSHTQKEGVKNWSTYLRTYFESIDDDIIFWGIDDHLIADHVDKEIINHLYKIIKENPTVGRIGLTNGIEQREYQIVQSLENFDVIELTQCESPNNPFAFRIDCNFGFWRREYLLKYLQNNWTPWQFEVEGSKLARNDNWRILATKRNYGILKVEGKRGILPGKINLLGIKFRDILNLLNLELVRKRDIVGEQDWLSWSERSLELNKNK